MDIRLLGQVEIAAGPTDITLDRAAERCVLATLAFNPGRPVRVATLIENWWGERPPHKAEETVGTYVRSVRRAIERAGGHRDLLRNQRPRSYVLDVEPATVDYHRFTSGVVTARTAASEGDHRGAIEEYVRALRLWRGEALSNVDSDWAVRRRTRLQQEWLDATCALLDAQLHAGEYTTVATRARELLSEHPTERILVLAMLGLAHSGQRAMIPGLYAEAAEQMWSAAGARPSAQVAETADRLASGEDAAYRPPSPADEASYPDSPLRIPRRDGTVIMSATGNRYVWQAAGDLHITGS